MHELWQQLKRYTAPRTPAFGALNVVFVAWTFLTSLAAVVMGAVGPWPVWTALVGLAVFASLCLALVAQMPYADRIAEVLEGDAPDDDADQALDPDVCEIDGERVPSPGYLRRMLTGRTAADVLSDEGAESFRRMHRRGALSPEYVELVGSVLPRPARCGCGAGPVEETPSECAEVVAQGLPDGWSATLSVAARSEGPNVRQRRKMVIRCPACAQGAWPGAGDSPTNATPETGS